MNGYVARKGNRWYAVIYEGLDPVTGREIRRWHAAGTNKAAAERLARRLARELNGPDDRGRGLSFGAFLTQTWLPAKRIELRPSTWAGYQRIVHRHVIGELGSTQIRRLRPEQLEDLYESKLRPTDGSRPLAPKTVLEIHVVIRGALNDAVQRGYVNINVALIAKAPRQRPAEEQTAWTAAQLATFLRHAAGHRYFPAIWTAAFTGVRRSELLGLKWSDLDPKHSTVSINRGRVDVNYQVFEAPDITPQIGASRGKPVARDAASTSTPPPSTCSPRGDLANDRTFRRRPGGDGVDVHRRARRTDPPSGDVTDLRPDRAPGAGADDPVPRPAPHPRHPADRCRRPGEGGR